MLPYRRAVLSVTIAISIAVSALAAVPSPAALAGGSCTGWTSITTPPDTVRVGRNDGRVEVVPFRDYVGVVMMSEWSPSHPPATLQAGAVAAKQYTWYYALAGNWRKSYINDAGECYDVKSSTADQLYKPENVGTVDPRMWRAVDATWGLSVRKSNQFFLTGYRTGQVKVCAADVNGYKLFAKSVINCGRIGWTREEIQLAYYAPDVTFHWSEEAPPPPPVETPISPPDVELLAGTRLGGENARVEWDEDDARPSTTVYELQRLVGDSWTEVALDDPAQPVLETVIRPNRAHQFRVRLVDGEGNAGPWYSGDRFVPRLVQNPDPAFTWSAGWRKGWTDKASGGSLGYSGRAGAQATFTFTGRALALVGTYGPKRGVARVYVDGELEAEIDMYAPTMRWRRIWFTRQWADSGPHSVVVEVVGTAGRPRVDVDAAIYVP